MATPVTAASAMDRLAEVAQDPDSYIVDWRRRTGRKVVGAFPMNFPAELAHAAGTLPVIIQESREPITIGRNLLTEFYCGYTRSVADQAAKGRLDIYDGFFNADHCIQLLGAVDIVRDEALEKPMYFGQFETSMGDEWAPAQVRNKMVSFQRELEIFVGHPISDAEISRSIALFNTNRRMLRRIFDERRAGNAYFTAGQLQVLVKSSMVMDRAEHTELLTAALAQEVATDRDQRIRLHLSGHFCHAPKPELLELIEDCGALIVDDDLYHGTRYISTDVDETIDPISALGGWYLGRNISIPCPTRVQHDVNWDDYLLRVIDESRADGVIILMAKFCEPHMLYYPELRKALAAHNIPLLLIETEHEGLPMESVRTRVEALLERIRRRELIAV